MMKWKDVEGSGHGLILRNQFQHLPVRTGENNELSQDSLSLGRDLNPGPPQYDAGVLTSRPRATVRPRNYVQLALVTCYGQPVMFTMERI
jgi:hypothetical protein